MQLSEINTLFKKNPTILKFMIQHHVGVSDHYIHHVSHLIQHHKNVLKEVKLVYSQYQNFQEMYIALLRVTNKSSSQSLTYSNKTSLMCNLESLDISYIEGKNNSLIAKIDNHESLLIYGSSTWCIYNSKNTFKKYTKNGQCNQYILFDFDNIDNQNFRIGFTHSDSYFIAFNNSNYSIEREHINKYLIPNNDFNLTKIKKTSIKNHIKNHTKDAMIFLGVLFSIPTSFILGSFLLDMEPKQSLEKVTIYTDNLIDTVSDITFGNLFNALNPIYTGKHVINYIFDIDEPKKINTKNDFLYMNNIEEKTCTAVNMIDVTSATTKAEAFSFARGEMGCLKVNKSIDESGNVLFFKKTSLNRY